jgi:hypothetical protein
MTLKAYYNFEQTSGDLLDLSGNGNNSTTVSVTSRNANGILGGNAYQFDGSNDYVQVAGITQGFSAITGVAWIKFNSGSGANMIIERGGWNSGEFGFEVNDGGVAIQMYEVSNPNNYGSVADGTWHMVAATYSNATGNMIAYDNGQEIGRDTGLSGTISSDSDDCYIGSRTGSNYFVDGLIAELRLYDRALTPQEIQYLYSVGKRGQLVSGKKTV